MLFLFFHFFGGFKLNLSDKSIFSAAKIILRQPEKWVANAFTQARELSERKNHA